MQIDNSIRRSEKPLRLPMAIETPTHLKVARFPSERHLVHLAVAGRATDAFVQMDAVVEVNVIRQIVNADPFEGPAGLPALTHRLKDRRVFPNLRMARHANLRRRNAGEGGAFDRGVAVTAINSEAADMMLMAERHRLLDW